jgi:hypothetical protein
MVFSWEIFKFIVAYQDEDCIKYGKELSLSVVLNEVQAA